MQDEFGNSAASGGREQHFLFKNGEQHLLAGYLPVLCPFGSPTPTGGCVRFGPAWVLSSVSWGLTYIEHSLWLATAANAHQAETWQTQHAYWQARISAKPAVHVCQLCMSRSACLVSPCRDELSLRRHQLTAKHLSLRSHTLLGRPSPDCQHVLCCLCCACCCAVLSVWPQVWQRQQQQHMVCPGIH